jgi:hypothetical protein
MFRFTIRDLVGLMVVAGASCGLGILISPADPVSVAIASGFLFVFGASCYCGGIAVARFGQQSNHERESPS